MSFRSVLETTTAGFVLAILAGCSQLPSRIEVPAVNPEDASAAALALYDADKDGAIAGAELDKCPGLKAGLRGIDANKDRRLTADEIAQRLRKYQQDRIGLVTFTGVVTLDGKPLSGGTVTLVPESFMGPSVEPARAVVDHSGGFQPVIEGVDMPGLRCGIYRIEISSKDARGGETVPEKYNRDTKLGIELGAGSPILSNGLDLALSSR